MIKINNKCRTCFNENSKGLQSLTKITTDESNQPKSYAELLNEVANINVLHDKCSAKLPQAICGCCSRKLKAAHAFVQQAQEVNEKLYSMLLGQQADEGEEGKPLDCLQEVQIDINACAEIKMEHDDTSDNSGNADAMDEEVFLKKGIQLKKEDAEEDILAENYSKNEENEEGNDLKDSLDVAYPSISLTTNMSDTEDNIPTNAFLQNMDSSDNNSNNGISSASASDDDEWPNKSNNSNNKSPKKKTTPPKKSKKSGKVEESAEKKLEDEDEWLQVKCNDCDKIFDNSRLLKRHLRLNHVPDELKIQCLHCEAKFSRRHNMYAHMRRMHKTENLEELQIQRKKSNADKQYVCQQCPRSYTNKYKLIAHVNSHHNPDNKNTAPKEKVLQPKKRFLCTLCGLKFDSEGNLNIHFRRHTGEKPYKCEFCDRAYPRLYDVQVHRRTHTGEKPYQCTLCEKTFRRSNKLKIHMRTHTNERPYKCTQCEKAFKQSKDLNIHKRTHTGERPYKCAVCQSTFTQSNSLRLHQIKQQHLEKPNPVDSLPGNISYVCQPT